MSTRDQNIVTTLAAPLAEPAPVSGGAAGEAEVSPADDQAASVWVTLLMIVAVVLRVLVLLLGPAIAMDQAVTPETVAHLSAVGLEAPPGVALPPVLAAAEQLELTRAEGGQDVLVGPIYPWLLQAVDGAALPRHVIVAVQCLLAAGCVPLVWLAGRGLLGRADAALVPAAIVAVHPALLVGAVAMTPTLWTLTLVLGGLGMVLAYPGMRSAVLGGVMLGVASLVTPAVVWVAAPLAVWLPIHRRSWKAFPAAGLLLVAAAAPPGVWVMRNLDAKAGARLSTEAEVAIALDLMPRVTATLPDLTPAGADAGLDARLSAVTTPALAALRAEPGATAAQVGRRAEHVLINGDITPLYRLLGLSVEPVDPIQAFREHDWFMRRQADPPGAWLSLLLQVVDAVLLAAGLIGAALLIWRRHRVAAVLPVLLVVGGLVAASLTLWPEHLRAVVIVGLALLAAAPAVPARPRKPRPKKVKKRPMKTRVATAFDKPIDAEDLEPLPEPRMGRPI